MSKGRYLFREAEVRRAVRAAESAGMKIGRIEIDSVAGKISLVPANVAESGAAVNEWDADSAP